MEYTLEYAGRSYDLPKFTTAVSNDISRINAQNVNSSMKDTEKYKNMYGFIRKMIGSENAMEIFGTENLDEMDLNDITICYLGICAGYEKPVNEFNRGNVQMNEEDKQFVLDILKNAGNLKELERMVNSKQNASTVARFAR